MKKTAIIGAAAFVFFALASCASGGGAKPPAQSTTQSAPEVPPPAPYFAGDGGKGMSLAVLIPDGKGLSTDQNYLPTLVQGVLVGDFNKYSQISVLDRQNLERVLKETESGVYKNEADFIQLGQIANVGYAMTGNITKTTSGYAMQIQIADTASGATKASYSGNCTIAEFDNFTGIRKASAELLAQMGVSLTDTAKTELSGAAAAQNVKAQTALAQGIATQKRGTEVAALSYYYQAAAFDPSLLEAANRASVMTASISSGNIGEDARNDIQWRRDWAARLTETERYFDEFFKTSAPSFGLFYFTELERGKINYQTETIPISFEVNLHASSIWFTSVERALQAVTDGLNRTGRNKDWGLRWPGISGLSPFKNGGKDFSVVFELVNAQNRVIGRQTLNCSASWRFVSFDPVELYFSTGNSKIVSFDAVKVDDITDTLTIQVASVNGLDPQTATQRYNLQITATDYWPRWFNFRKGTITMYFSSQDENGNRREMVIPETLWGEPVTAIGEGAFSGDNQLNGVIIPDSVTTIGREAFRNIIAISIGNNVRLGGERGTSFSGGFDEVYNKTGRKAGTYIYGYNNKNGWSFFEGIRPLTFY